MFERKVFVNIIDHENFEMYGINLNLRVTSWCLTHMV